jgi:hypothetical protein
MTQNTFEQHTINLDSLADSIVQAKRPEYTRDSPDVLSNFKETAAFCGITPMQVWGVHFFKHFSAIMRMVKNPTGIPSESLDSRFADLRNYVRLGYAVGKETLDK